jgi:hypothetical protein
MHDKGSSSGFHFFQDAVDCERMFYWSYVERLEAIGTARYHSFGTAGHHAMAQYYMGSQDPKVLIDEFLGAMEVLKDRYGDSDSRDEDWLTDRSFGKVALEGYYAHYAKQGKWQIAKLADGSPAVEFPVSIVLPSGNVLTGRVDLAIEMQGEIYIVDHKFTRWQLSKLANSLGISGQSTSYLLMTRDGVFPKPPRAMIYNCIYTSRQGPDWKRFVVHKTEEDINEFAYMVDKKFTQLTEKATDPKTIRWDWIKNDKACFRFNRPCQFLPLCKGDNYMTLLDIAYRRKPDEDEEYDNPDD